MAIRELSEFIDIQLLKNDGTVNILGTLEFYDNLTLNPANVYAESSLTTSLGATVALDAAGRWLSSEVWLPGPRRIRCKDSVGNLLWTKDNINVDTSAAGTVSGANLITNGSFETDANADNVPDGWSLTSFVGSTNTLDSTTQSDGAKSLKSTSTGNGGGTWTHDAYIEIDDKARYTADYDLKSSIAAANDVRIIIELLWYDGSKVQLGGGSASTTLYDIAANNPGSFTHFQNDIGPPSGARYCRPRVRLCDSSDNTSGSAWCDAFSLSKQPGALNLPGAFSAAGATTLGGTLALTADISPAQITADQNDYNPTGLSTATVLRLSTDAARNITGLAGGADGRVITIINIGSFDITLKNNDVGSTAGNRFSLNSDLVIQTQSAAILCYDTTTARWRAVSATTFIVADGSITEVKLAASAVSQGKLKTANSDIAIDHGSPVTVGAPADFMSWPYYVVDNSSVTANIFLVDDSGVYNPAGSPHFPLVYNQGSAPYRARFRYANTSDPPGGEYNTYRIAYIQSSPPYDLGDGQVHGFIYGLIETNGKAAFNISEDPPWINLSSNMRPEYVRNGKKYRRRLVLPPLTRGVKPGELEAYLAAVNNPVYEEIEITPALKNTDMDLQPSPFVAPNRGQTIILLDPMSDVVRQIMEIHNSVGPTDKSPVGKILFNYIHIDNIRANRRAPAGIMPVGLRWKSS